MARQKLRLLSLLEEVSLYRSEKDNRPLKGGKFLPPFFFFLKKPETLTDTLCEEVEIFQEDDSKTPLTPVVLLKDFSA